MDIFKYITAKFFFKEYCPTVKSWVHKTRGKNGRGNPVAFSDQDKEEIKKGIQRLCNDLLNAKP